jgi:hypothetical protein
MVIGLALGAVAVGAAWLVTFSRAIDGYTGSGPLALAWAESSADYASAGLQPQSLILVAGASLLGAIIGGAVTVAIHRRSSAA